jgi:hypothetical protein
MPQLQRLLHTQKHTCFLCDTSLEAKAAAVVRLPGAVGSRSDEMAFACCKRSAAILAQYEPKEQLVAMLYPEENALCGPIKQTSDSVAANWSGPGLAPGQTPKANADLCPPRPVKSSLLSHSPMPSQPRQFIPRAPIVRCTECDMPAMPGDSRCYQHIK